MDRKEAFIKGLVKYNTGKPCKHGHTSDRYTSTGGCIDCLKGVLGGPRILVNCHVHPDDEPAVRLFVQSLNEARQS